MKTTINAEKLKAVLEEQIRISSVLLGSDKELLFSMLDKVFVQEPEPKSVPKVFDYENSILSIDWSAYKLPIRDLTHKAKYLAWRKEQSDKL